MRKLIKDSHPALFGILSALIIGAIIYSLGHLSGYKAHKLINQSVDNFSMLCNTISLASATILALLLTALSTSVSSDTNIKEQHYKGIIKLTTIVTFTFIASLFSFMLLLVPITESEEFSAAYYNNYYWVMLIGSSVLVGLMITIALMLRKVIINITELTALKVDDHELIEDAE